MKPGKDILVVGNGGREHALAWKFRQSPQVGKIFCAPGNAGTAEVAENIPIKADDVDALLAFAKEKNIDMTIVGPEGPLQSGIVDMFEAEGQRIFGPRRFPAMIELSKSFGHNIMRAAGVASANYRAFTDYHNATSHIEEMRQPCVVKADGPALGKGVYVCENPLEAKVSLHRLMMGRVCGGAGEKVVIEERLKGIELSAMAVCDGKDAKMLLVSIDHKRARDGDRGLNTGGMGAVAMYPSLFVNIYPNLEEEILNRIVRPILLELRSRGATFKGLMFPGIMLTKEGLKVLELNARYGDPETQVVLPLMKTDLYELTDASIRGDVSGVKMEWHEKAAVGIVIASKGYPGKYATGKPIDIPTRLTQDSDIIIFHAATKLEEGKLLTSGGRVLTVTATEDNLTSALEKANKAVNQIAVEDGFHRTDIGQRAKRKLKL